MSELGGSLEKQLVPALFSLRLLSMETVFRIAVMLVGDEEGLLMPWPLVFAISHLSSPIFEPLF